MISLGKNKSDGGRALRRKSAVSRQDVPSIETEAGRGDTMTNVRQFSESAVAPSVLCVYVTTVVWFTVTLAATAPSSPPPPHHSVGLGGSVTLTNTGAPVLLPTSTVHGSDELLIVSH